MGGNIGVVNTFVICVFANCSIRLAAWQTFFEMRIERRDLVLMISYPASRCSTPLNIAPYG